MLTNSSPNQELTALSKYMTPLTQSKESLTELARNWDTLSLMSQIGDAGMNMQKIKTDFVSLSDELMHHFGAELLKKVVAQMDSKAHMSIDILIRNLFERTADIGFLATDDAIREFLIHNPTKYTPNAQESAQELKKRFIEYAKKYSVYSDIVLLNPQGEILVRIDSSQTLQKSHDPLIQEALETDEEYLESFKVHDFITQEKESLIYAYKVTQSSASNAPAIGTLCLCFRFENEMHGIFNNLANSQTKECLTLLDATGTVIASSDKYHIPLGASLEIITNDPYKIVSFAGRDYLAKSASTKGYQGFEGLGWYGHIMIPLEFAFESFEGEDFEISQSLLLAILQHSQRFSKTLKAIPLKAAAIQHNLYRAIWNGDIKQNNSHNQNKQFSKALLLEIKKAGENTKEIIAESMAQLTKTMALSDTTLLANLIVDIMDRNLYERANDCRWWALTPDFRKILQEQTLSLEASQTIGAILKQINKLYTVYTNLFVYDKNGVIIAVSQQSESHLIGQRLTQSWTQESLTLSDTSKYCVSDFESSHLYDGEPTYIYSAAIRAYSDDSLIVGGIGIVFDAKVQFQAMIEESLPSQDAVMGDKALFSLLVTQEQTIIASNNSDFKTGESFSIDRKFFQLNNGESLSEIIEFRGEYYALGVSCSKGYREYKSASDDYSNNVYSFVFSYISSVEETQIEQVDTPQTQSQSITPKVGEDTLEIATFFVGKKWLGIPTEDVLEALSIDKLSNVVKMDADHHFKGTMLYGESVISVIDISDFIQGEAPIEPSEIIVVKFGKKGFIGILASSLGTIESVAQQNIRPLDEYIIGNGTLVESVVFPSNAELSSETLSILNVRKIQQKLVEPNLTHMNKRELSYS